jgi:multicomponent Na+:H+ antiporter subunit E
MPESSNLKQGLDYLKQISSQQSSIAKQKAKQALDSIKHIDKEKLKQLAQQQTAAAKHKAEQLLDRNNPPQFRISVASIALFVLWLILISDRLSVAGVFAGAIAAILTAWLSSNHLMFIDQIKFSTAMPLHILRFCGAFMLALLRSNFDMARRVLSPQLPINPVIVLVETKLKSPLGKLLLANSITLTPGTLTVDVLDDKLQIHWVDGSAGTDLEHATKLISQSFEQHLQGFIE